MLNTKQDAAKNSASLKNFKKSLVVSALSLQASCSGKRWFFLENDLHGPSCGLWAAVTLLE